MIYTIQNHCLEVEELNYEDGLKFLYFYVGGTKGGSDDIWSMLLHHDYIELLLLTVLRILPQGAPVQRGQKLRSRLLPGFKADV